MAVECATYSVAEAAKRLGISRAYAYDLIRRGAFPAAVFPIGTRIVVSRASLEQYIAEGSDALPLQTNGTHSLYH